MAKQSRLGPDLRGLPAAAKDGAVRRSGHRCLLCGLGLALAAAFLLVSHSASADSSPTEYQVKAAYLFNFLKFVQWPNDASPDPQRKWVIGVVGDSPIAAELSLLVEGKTVDGRGLLVKRLLAGDSLGGCNILFVSASEERHLASILTSVQGSSVLTVSDFDKFIERGGMIQFVNDGGRVRMDIDVGATGRARLKISSKLLALAQAVTETAKDAHN